MSLILISACENGKSPPPNKDLCHGAAIIWYNASSSYDLKEKIRIQSNNEFACEQCFNYLSREEQIVCQIDE